MHKKCKLCKKYEEFNETTLKAIEESVKNMKKGKVAKIDLKKYRVK